MEQARSGNLILVGEEAKSMAGSYAKFVTTPEGQAVSAAGTYAAQCLAAQLEDKPMPKPLNPSMEKLGRDILRQSIGMN